MWGWIRVSLGFGGRFGVLGKDRGLDLGFSRVDLGFIEVELGFNGGYVDRPAREMMRSRLGGKTMRSSSVACA